MAIAANLLLGVFYWSAASAISGGAGRDYPNSGFLVTAQWLKSHQADASLVIVDVRMDKYIEGKLIPGAVRMPWQQFQYDDTAGEGRMDAVFALLGGLAGTALFAELHETLISILYDSTNLW